MAGWSLARRSLLTRLPCFLPPTESRKNLFLGLNRPDAAQSQDSLSSGKIAAPLNTSAQTTPLTLRTGATPPPRRRDSSVRMTDLLFFDLFCASLTVANVHTRLAQLSLFSFEREKKKHCGEKNNNMRWLARAGATEINTLRGEYEQPAPGSMSKAQEMVSHRRAHKLGP